MAKARANGIEICYEQQGDESGVPLLMVHGLGAQLTGWPPELRELLVAEGFRLVYYDNRDIGLSTHFDEAGMPKLVTMFTAGRISAPPYRLEDMADDAIGLLDVLGIETAHVVGVSMGGMIAQTIAIRHPGRVRSLCSIMSTTGARGVGTPTNDALAVLIRPFAKSRDEAIEQAMATLAVIGSPGFPHDGERERQRYEAAYDRMYHPEGVARQLAAIMAARDRTKALGSLRVPTLVIHGAADPLIRLSGGEATAKAIPGAKLIVIDGMGHDLPVEVYGQVVAALTANAREAAGDRPSGTPPGTPGAAEPAAVPGQPA